MHPLFSRFLKVGATSFGIAALTTFMTQTVIKAGETSYSLIYSIISPLFGPLFKLSGVEEISSLTGTIYSLFTIFYIQALLIAVPAAKDKLRQLDILDIAYGKPSKPQHWRWYAASVMFLLFALCVGFLPKPPLTGMELVLTNCLKIAATMTGFTGFVASAVMATRLHKRWAAAVEPVQDRVMAQSIAEQQSSSELSIYIALAAELVHSCGRDGIAPDPIELEVNLAQLQEAAQITRDSQFNHDNLAHLCTRACYLFESAALTKLPNLETARALSRRADPIRLIDIAEELKQLIEPEGQLQPMRMDMNTSSKQKI